MPRCDIDAQLFLGELAGADLERIGSRFNVHATLHSAFFVESQCQGRLVVDDGSSHLLGHVFQWRADSQCIGNQAVVVPTIREVKTVQQIEGFAVERADRKHIGRKFQNQTVLCHRLVERGRIHKTRADPSLIHRGPTVVSLALIFF